MKAQSHFVPNPDNQSLQSPFCRFCGSVLRHTFIDLGMSPLCESYLTFNQLNQMEAFYPLHVYVCEKCFLVQLEEYVDRADIFSDYAYFSSYADSWLQHAKNYTKRVVKQFQLDDNSSVIEIASNDGYLLQYFQQLGIPVLGVEPAKNVAEVALKKGIPTLNEFFDNDCARRLSAIGKKADLLIGNNILAQVPDINDFVEGMKEVLKPSGVITMEFPHILQLILGNQFDTIYHEHFSYFSFSTVEKIFLSHKLTIFDVEEIPTHGGSLRIYARHADDSSKLVSESAINLRQHELHCGVTDIVFYQTFAEKVKETKRKVLDFLIKSKRMGKSIVGYGAPGKGNTFLNYCGIRTDFLDYTVDRNPHKQGMYLPGTHIPIYGPEKIRETKPDYVFILAWNVKKEIMEQMSDIREWAGQFVVSIPEIQIY